MSSYALLSKIYDQWQEENDSVVWADYTEKIIRKHLNKTSGDGENNSLLLLDLGCGTGGFSIEMAERGYDVLAMDQSADMLLAAKEKENSGKVQFILQDITKMKLYGTVDVMVCYLDTINHILDISKLDRLFRLCKNYLNPEGLLIFDMATPYYFDCVLGEQIFYDIKEQYTLLWQNSVDHKRQTSISELIFFLLADDGTYLKSEETIKEKMHTIETIEELLLKNKLTLIKKYDSLKFTKPKADSKRIFFVASNKNDEWKMSLMKKDSLINLNKSASVIAKNL